MGVSSSESHALTVFYDIFMPGLAQLPEIQSYKVPDTPKPHILLGATNLIEEAADHHPAPPQASAALLDLRVNLHLIDGCRCTNPPLECMYTLAQPGNGSRSRIDRIYAMED